MTKEKTIRPLNVKAVQNIMIPVNTFPDGYQWTDVRTIRVTDGTMNYKERSVPRYKITKED